MLRGRHAEIIDAELRLRVHYRGLLRIRSRGMPPTFGRGTEVLPASTPIDLTRFFNGEDVTDLFSGSRRELPLTHASPIFRTRYS